MAIAFPSSSAFGLGAARVRIRFVPGCVRGLRIPFQIREPVVPLSCTGLAAMGTSKIGNCRKHRSRLGDAVGEPEADFVFTRRAADTGKLEAGDLIPGVRPSLWRSGRSLRRDSHRPRQHVRRR